jgi:uncharacterized Zn-binding protein involved in type VI secretion|tara:strand:+ start:3322 stop:3612 length:291 start_codon:yes stop_codon:yes gene_type:complete
MTASARKDDSCTGHGCWPPRPTPTGSSNVFINSKPSHRKGDDWLPHVCPPAPPHGAVTESGSPNVFVNGEPMARVGDSLSCGSLIKAGSPNVFANN